MDAVDLVDWRGDCTGGRRRVCWYAWVGWLFSGFILGVLLVALGGSYPVEAFGESALGGKVLGQAGYLAVQEGAGNC